MALTVEQIRERDERRRELARSPDPEPLPPITDYPSGVYVGEDRPTEATNESVWAPVVNGEPLGADNWQVRLGNIWKELPSPIPDTGLLERDIREFGVVGDGVADDLPGFQAAADWIKSTVDGGIVKLTNPSVAYRISGEIDCFIPASDGKRQIWRGEDHVLTVIRPDFAGRGKALFRFVDPDWADPVLGGRHSPVEFQGGLYLRHMSQAVAHPVFVWVHGAGEFQQRGVLRLGGANNTVLRLNGAQNLRADLIYNDSGGRVWTYRPLDGVGFTVNGTTTVTADAPVFTAADVGKVFWLFRNNVDYQRYRFVIQTYVGPTQVILDHTAPVASSATYRGFFEPPAITVASGDTAASVDGDGCFAADSVGTRLYIPTSDDLFVTTIEAFGDANHVTLADPAPEDITGEPFATPGIEITGWDFATGSTRATDVRVRLLHIENGIAVPLLLKDCQQTWVAGKIENETGPVDATAPDGCMWIDNVEGSFVGDLSGSNSGRHRIMAWAQEHPFDVYIKTRRAQGERIVRAHSFANPNGVVRVRDATLINNDVAANFPWNLVDDDNGPTDRRVGFYGGIDTDTTSERSRTAVGPPPDQTWFDLAGNLTGLGDVLGITDLTSDLGSAALRFGKLYLGQQPITPFRSTSGSTTLGLPGSDGTLAVNASGGTATITVPSPGSVGTGRMYEVVRTNASGGYVDLVPASGLIGGASKYRLFFAGDWVRIKVDNTATSWVVIGAPGLIERRRAAHRPVGALAESLIDRDLAVASTTAPATGRLELHTIFLRGGVPLSGLKFRAGTSGGSGLTHCAFSLYDTDAITLLKACVDDTTATWAAQTARSQNWVGGGTYTPPVDGEYFAGIQAIGTPPTLAGSSILSNVSGDAAPWVSAIADTVTDGTPPAIATPTAAKGGHAYVYAF